jgi:hypothetical protein
MNYNPRDESSIKAVMAKSNVVINLIGSSLFLKDTGTCIDRQWFKRDFSLLHSQDGNMKQETTVLRR